MIPVPHFDKPALVLRVLFGVSASGVVEFEVVEQLYTLVETLENKFEFLNTKPRRITP